MKSSAAVNFLAMVALLLVLREGRFIFLPFVLALFLWILIWVLETAFARYVEKFRLPHLALRFGSIFSVLFIVGAFGLAVSGLSSQLPEVASRVQGYMENVPQISANLGIDLDRFISLAPASFKLENITSQVIQDTAALVRTLVMVIIYLCFMLMESASLRRKLPLIFKGTMKKDANVMLNKILVKIRTYLFLKSVSSIITGGLAYALMSFVGVEFAALWAGVIAVMNFIPTVGAIISSACPIILSLLQFNGAMTPFLTMLVGMIGIQVAVSILEPRIMGKNVDISPLVQIVSMVAWGWIWGVPGMFLCIPIMIMLSIVLYNIPATKKYAILMSEDGDTI